jgi:hypothetical protein
LIIPNTPKYSTVDRNQANVHAGDGTGAIEVVQKEHSNGFVAANFDLLWP